MRNGLVILGIVAALVIMGIGLVDAQYLQNGRWTQSYFFSYPDYGQLNYNPITGWASAQSYGYGLYANWYQGYVSPWW